MVVLLQVFVAEAVLDVGESLLWMDVEGVQHAEGMEHHRAGGIMPCRTKSMDRWRMKSCKTQVLA
jgi:hypothetical protein